MELTSTTTRRVITLVSAAACAVGVIAGGGPAAAQDTLGKLDTVTCRGTSPNIIDLPYSVAINARQIQKPIEHNHVVIYLQQGVTFFAPYTVTGTLSWVSRRSGARGSVPINDTIRRQFIPLYDTPSHDLDLHPGLGPLDVTVQVQPEGRVPTGPVTCVGHFNVI